MDKINIVVNSSDEYSVYCGIMLTSMFESNKENNFRVFVFTTGMKEENQNKLLSLNDKYGQEVIIMIVSDDLVKRLPIHFSYHNMAVYLRVMAAEILPVNISKFLYLDCDIIVNGDISELWNIDISNYAIAATKDLPRFAPLYAKNLGVDINEYFNSGVMLINSEYWRKNGITGKVIDYASNNAEKIIACDQDAMNAIFSKTDKVLLLSRKWNVYPDVFFVKPDLYPEEMQEISSIRENPIMIHFMYKKPWFSDCVHPYKKLFEKFYKKYTGISFRAIKSKHPFTMTIKRDLKFVLYRFGLIKIYNVFDTIYLPFQNRITW